MIPGKFYFEVAVHFRIPEPNSYIVKCSLGSIGSQEDSWIVKRDLKNRMQDWKLEEDKFPEVK